MREPLLYSCSLVSVQVVGACRPHSVPFAVKLGTAPYSTAFVDLHRYLMSGCVSIVSIALMEASLAEATRPLGCLPLWQFLMWPAATRRLSRDRCRVPLCCDDAYRAALLCRLVMWMVLSRNLLLKPEKEVTGEWCGLEIEHCSVVGVIQATKRLFRANIAPGS